ncbi:MAG: Holliday junction resolvase RuvX [Clostridia bacterium]|nr:Holliday junction resolvase RuvX [Clostridia bacterium]
MRLMGIDFGDARVGIALSDPLMIMSQGYKTIKNDGTDALFLEIAEIIKEKEVTKIIIGLPKNMDNSQGFRTDATMDFVEKLKNFTDVEIDFSDERLTTVSAHGFLNEMNVRGKKRKDTVDTLSAALILETYMKKNGLL